jgi:hypothetical protein
MTQFPGLSRFERNVGGALSDPAKRGDFAEVKPYVDIAPGVQLGFERGNTASISIGEKADPSRSPETCVNQLVFSFSGSSRWLTLEIAGGWDDLDRAAQFQLGIYAKPSRIVDCRAVVRLPLGEVESEDVELASFRMPDGDACFNRTGSMRALESRRPEVARPPKLILFFDNRGALSLRLDYLTAYFA